MTRVSTAPAPIGARRRSIEALLEKRRTSLKAAKLMKEMASQEAGTRFFSKICWVGSSPVASLCLSVSLF